MATEAEILQAFTGGRIVLERPWVHGGKTFASNGHILVCFEREIEGVQPPLTPLKTGRIEGGLSGTQFVPAPAAKFPDAVWSECPDCEEGNSDGCEECGGRGKIIRFSDMQFARFRGRVFNVEYLRNIWMLPGLMVPAALPNDRLLPALFRFDGGWAALMAVDNKTERATVSDVFPPEFEGAA